MKEHLNDYEKRIWEGIDKDAEEIIKMVEADPEAKKWIGKSMR